jgi:DNA mismatch endonuclease (patch repair protein)
MPATREMTLNSISSDPARSAQMARVKGKDTKPEMVVRRFLHAAGLRYRLHQRIAGARPDIVFSSRHIAVFVHGCIWHQHPDPSCKLARMPKSRLEFWKPKLEGNRARDERQRAALEAAGWKVLTVWECQIGDRGRLEGLAAQIESATTSNRNGPDVNGS